MKKVALMAFAAFALTACTTVIKTSKTASTPAQLLCATVADLEVSPHLVVVEYSPVPKEIQRAGLANAKHAAEQMALAPDSADVLVNAEYTIQMTKNQYSF